MANLVRGTFLRIADVRSQPANISVAASRSTPSRRVVPSRKLPDRRHHSTPTATQHRPRAPTRAVRCPKPCHPPGKTVALTSRSISGLCQVGGWWVGCEGPVLPVPAQGSRLWLASQQPSWPGSADAWKPSPRTCWRRCRAPISAPAGSVTCVGGCWRGAASRSSRWPPGSARSTTRPCTTSSGSRRGTGGRSGGGWPRCCAGRCSRPPGWWTTPASPRTVAARSGCSASPRARWARPPTASWGVGRRRDRAGLCPLDWRLVVPERWDEAAMAARRAACQLPAGVHHRPKWQLVLDMLDELAGWDLVAPVLLADSAMARSASSAGAGRPPDSLGGGGQGRHLGLLRACPLHRCAVHGQGPPSPAARPRPPMLAGPARPSSWAAGLGGADLAARDQGAATRPVPGAAGAPGRGHPRRLARLDGGELPVRWLLAEGPPGQASPTKYWLSNLPEATPLVELVRLARLRWRVEQDYRELKGPLGWTTSRARLGGLAPPPHPGLGRARLPDPGTAPPPKTGGVGLSLWQLLGELQVLLAGWAGACPLCKRPAPRWLRRTGPPRAPT